MLPVAEWVPRAQAALEHVPLQPAAWVTPVTLPVAGLGSVPAQDVVFNLRAVGTDGGVAEAWLRVVQLGQLLHDRLMRDLHDADRNLGFWQRQLAGGGSWSHTAFMLLGRGPAAFAADAAVALRHLHAVGMAALEHAQRAAAVARGAGPEPPGGPGPAVAVAAAAPRAEEAAAAPGNSGAAGLGAAVDGGAASASDLMQQRVLLLRAQRTRLAVAVGRVAFAIGELHTATQARLDGSDGLIGLKPVHDALRQAASRMRRVVEELLHPRPPHRGDPWEDVIRVEGTLESELAALEQLLRLRPLAARALRMRPAHTAPPPPSPQQQAPGAPALPAAAAAAPAGGGAAAASSAGGEAPGAAPAAGLALTWGGASARDALNAARRAAALSGPLLALPAVARMPSSLQRHWLRYTAAAALVSYGGLWLLRHSSLAGSDDLARWWREGVAAARSALTAHVVEPLAAVRDELFATFRDRPAIVSASDFSASRASLRRMLADFEADQGGGGGGGGAAGGGGTAGGGGGASGGGAGGASGGGGGGAAAAPDADVASGMAVLMRSYEADLRRPLRGLLAGDLARALLIQVQHVKVDGEAAMLRLDQILRANELSLSLAAALPAVGLLAAAGAGLARLLLPRAPDPGVAAAPARVAMGALGAALEAEAGAEEALGAWVAQYSERPARPDDWPREAVLRAARDEARGLTLYRLQRVYREVAALCGRPEAAPRASEWPALAADLQALAAPAPPARRLAAHARVERTYSLFARR